MEKSSQIIQQIEEEIKKYETELQNFDYFAKMFDFPEKTQEAHKNMKMIKNETDLIRRLWAHIKKVQDQFSNNLLMCWKAIDAVEMQDNTKKLNKELTKIKGVDRKSNVYKGIAKDIRNWVLFLPIIEDLKKDAMVVPDDRHWKDFKTIIEKNFEVNDNMQL
ncbi:MAG: hypothetical protein GY786_00655 [Proteobacteria bacterium]|nr:hypothetical protein [Pseudomonadota bacterium]